ncbi:hypothetical protein C9374_009971 [Naegleria lovaniensis]|uniref:Uncharacterized protein n=1 Tax=Naegleria lovaniensis TaxID=51637 RepID=A0AA88KEV1_NAELO|nr:uncharacterized protein C9374_009971 [Naegleria lovaniensis]KAG2375348.1 hypothetical protein C9374_009971 [Naegleria lovaniensis]
MGNKQLDRHSVIEIHQKTNLPIKEIKEWYALFYRQFQDVRISKDRFSSAMKIQNLPSSYEVISSGSPYTTTQNGGGDKQLMNTTTQPYETATNSDSEKPMLPNRNGDDTFSTTSTAPPETQSSPNLNQRQETPAGTSSPQPGLQNNSSTISKNSNPQSTVISFPDLVFETSHVMASKYFFAHEYLPPKRTHAHFHNLLPIYDVYAKGNKVTTADFAFTTITCPQLVEDTDNPSRKKQYSSSSLSFRDMAIFFEVIYNYLQLRPFELEKLPKHLQDPDSCARFVFQNILNHFGTDSTKENIESKSISKSQFIDYCTMKVSQEGGAYGPTTHVQQM